MYCFKLALTVSVMAMAYWPMAAAFTCRGKTHKTRECFWQSQDAAALYYLPDKDRTCNTPDAQVPPGVPTHQFCCLIQITNAGSVSRVSC
ncbi:hypothetical protein PGTUg99_000389 [Puccinia graminis f. sp. tritici]|uniref:Secreted protein n=2 Tax=Puccinia graminis f. sp. tritici TaxID=56615 RepID=A0A5B0S343_PUCGR|nr:hypothetical protein PGTUg99_000389 [Puccinia graminis f. sp. tritici]